ncbi:MAG TPA: hypothetical protein VMW56_21650 [Candidatus Margulisiibacteriota bacterium]|nr:hypothetical protein [Candidatus Margulisiibacteriota bacterium]
MPRANRYWLPGQRQRYRIVVQVGLAAALEIDVERLAAVHREWIDTALERPLTRQPQWSASVAVGGRAFAERVLGDLGMRARGRHVEPWDSAYVVRVPPAAYGAHLPRQNTR